jgi:hypothetical protein
MNNARTWITALALLLGTTSACAVGDDSSTEDTTTDTDTDTGDDNEDVEVTPYDEALQEREVDYASALRIAALRLTGDLPALQDIKDLERASDAKAAYETLVAMYIADPRFAETQIEFWKNTFKMGGSNELDSAGIFAAQLVVENRSYLELLTAASGTCPTYDAETNAFVPGECDNGVDIHAGLLSHPGMNAHFSSNMAFRRTRWVQETFACTAFPTELADEPQQLSDTAIYTAPWEFSSIAGIESGGDIDFLDYQSVVCANCHATMNHMAPLFGYFDDQGQATTDIAVPKPVDGNPMTTMLDWLPEGETTAWRVDQPVSDLVGLGDAMANDPRIAECAVARAWNWAMGKGDIVDTLSLVPPEVFAAQYNDFTTNYDFKNLIYQVFTSEDFIRF